MDAVNLAAEFFTDLVKPFAKVGLGRHIVLDDADNFDEIINIFFNAIKSLIQFLFAQSIFKNDTTLTQACAVYPPRRSIRGRECRSA